MYLILMNIIARIGHERQALQRTIHYEMKSYTMKSAESAQTAKPIVVTIAVYPSKLGILVNSDALITIPSGFKLKICEMIDMSERRRRKRLGTRHLNGHNKPPLPHILEIKAKVLK